MILKNSDAVFGVKSSLVEKPTVVNDEKEAKKYGFSKAPFHLVERGLRRRGHRRAAEGQGKWAFMS